MKKGMPDPGAGLPAGNPGTGFPAGEGEMSDETLTGLADDLFQLYDAEEADAPSPS